MGDLICPKCGEVVRGASDQVSVASFIHQETPGRCRPETCGGCGGDGRCHGPCGDCPGYCHRCFGTGRTPASTGKAGEGDRGQAQADADSDAADQDAGPWLPAPPTGRPR